MRLQRNIAGDKARPQDGLLYSNFAYLNAELNTVQRATPGTGPAFLPGSYLARMNSLTDYYVGGEAEYFAAAIAALGLRDRVEAPVTFARTLYGQALNGTANEPQFALGSQVLRVSLPTRRGLRRVLTDRVGFFVGANGALYRVETVGGATDRARRTPRLRLPQLQRPRAAAEHAEPGGREDQHRPVPLLGHRAGRSVGRVVGLLWLQLRGDPSAERLWRTHQSTG